jgi:hypothetical protein
LAASVVGVVGCSILSADFAKGHTQPFIHHLVRTMRGHLERLFYSREIFLILLFFNIKNKSQCPHPGMFLQERKPRGLGFYFFSF